MDKPEVVTLTLLEFKGIRNKWKAFKYMGLSNRILPKSNLPKFAKMLGSGAGSGFSHFPNFSVYSFLGVWAQEQDATQFFNSNNWFKDCIKASANQYTLYMQTCGVHGKWEGQTPFTPTIELHNNKPLAIITRATIHPSKLLRFWQFVQPVSLTLKKSSKKIFALGIGELPLIQQATFSLWENIEALQNFAYNSTLHSKVVQLTRKEGWYKEDLFARFHPYKTVGKWKNLNFKIL